MKMKENKKQWFLNYPVYFGNNLAFIVFFHSLPKFLRFKGSLSKFNSKNHSVNTHAGGCFIYFALVYSAFNSSLFP